MRYSDNQIVEKELYTDEKIVWIGKPKAKAITGGGIFLSLFGGVFIAFSLFWITTAYNQGNHEFHMRISLMDKIFPFFGLIFLIIGIAIFLSPIWIYRGTKNTIYVITNKRCIIIKASRTKRVSSYSKENLSIVDRVEKQDGTGDIIFFREQYTTTSNDTTSSHVENRNIGFYSIENVRQVELYLRNLVDS